MAIEERTQRFNAKTQEWEDVTTRRYSQKVATDIFTMLLHPVHPLLMRVKHVKDFHALFGLCELAEFNTNRVFLIASRRRDLMALTGMSSQHLANCLKRLREAGIVQGGRGEVFINPQVAWKGTSLARSLAIKAQAGKGMGAVKSNFDQK